MLLQQADLWSDQYHLVDPDRGVGNILLFQAGLRTFL